MGLNEQICADFWDLDLVWHREIPDFTDCFQHIVLVLFPCIIFWLCAIPYLLFVRHQERQCLPWTLLNISKIVLCSCLIILCVFELYFIVYQRFILGNIPDVSVYSASAKIITYILVIVVLIHHRLYGVRSSTFLFAFWFIFSISSSVIYWSTFLKVLYHEFPSVSHEKFILNTLCCPLILLQFGLSSFTDAKKYSILERKSPLDEESFFSLLTFSFMNSIVLRSRKKLLAVSDFPPLSSLLQSANQWKKFHEKWEKCMMKRWLSKSASHKAEPSSAYLVWMTIKAFWPWILLSVLAELLYDVLRFIPPLLLDLIIDFADDTSEYLWKGYFYCVLMLCTVYISNYVYGASVFYPTLFAMQLKAAFTSAIYRKSLRISSSAKKKYTCGEMVNLMSVDVDRIFQCILYFTLAFGVPLRIFITIVLLWQYLGPSCLAGVAVIVLMIPGTILLAKINHSVQGKQMEMKDVRLKLVSELLNGIKLLKLFAWEEPFLQKLCRIRQKEVKYIRNFYICYAGSSFFWGCAPFLIAVACFTTYVLVDEKNILYPSTVFVSINLVAMLRFSLFAFPGLISQIVQTKISVKRLWLFLTSEEYSDDSVGDNPDEGDAVTIRNATLSWGSDEDPVLKGLNFHVKKGSLVAVIGLVGCGKSSLLSALLGIMHKISGSVDVKGKLAYVPQQAWIQNKTVQENILFMQKMNKKKYDEILDCCCLKPDLKILPAGDQTEIGEKGVNMSGGQKQRISLARAIYHSADVYLMDDPLSAVDTHVGNHIFENVIGPNGLLKDKTRIIVTHSLFILPNVDVIVTMKDGRIEEVGTYEKLINHNGPFAELIQKHSTVAEAEKEEEVERVDTMAYVTHTSSDSQLSLHQSLSNLSFISSAIPGGRIVEDERMEIGKVKRHLYLNYLNHGGVWIFLFAISGYMGYQAFEIGANIWLKEWSNDPLLSDGSQLTSLRNYRILIYTVLGLCEAIFVVLGCVLLAIACARASKIYHSQMLWSVMKSPMSFFDTTPMGRIMNRFSKDIDVIDSQLPFAFDGWLACFFAVVATFIVIAMTTPEFLIALGIVGIFYYLLQELFLQASRQLKRLETTTRSPILNHFAETIQGVSCIKAYNVEEKFINTLETRIDTNTNCYFCWSCCNRWSSFRLDLLGCFIVFVTSVLSVMHKGSIEGALVGLSLNYALTVTSTLTWLVRNGVELENMTVSVERIDEYSKTRPEAPWHIEETKPPESWPANGTVVFKGYGTRYREGLNLVLEDFTLEILAGEKIAIVGRTGAGKTSVTLALFRIIEPAMGSLFIDDVDVSKIGLHDLRCKLTIIPQDPVLFTGTLRSNLDPGSEYSDDEVWHSLENAHLKKFISTLPEGLQHDIAEGGENLSIGQRQLICLARALLKRTKILVLDEATAGVDVETDSLIQETISREFHHHTVITIAHRLNTVIDYDRVIVMEDGKIVETGVPQELMQDNDSRFYSMAKAAGLV